MKVLTQVITCNCKKKEIVNNVALMLSLIRVQSTYQSLSVMFETAESLNHVRKTSEILGTDGVVGNCEGPVSCLA